MSNGATQERQVMLVVTDDMAQDARLIRSYFAERNWPDVKAVDAIDRMTSQVLRAFENQRKG